MTKIKRCLLVFVGVLGLAHVSALACDGTGCGGGDPTAARFATIGGTIADKLSALCNATTEGSGKQPEICQHVAELRQAVNAAKVLPVTAPLPGSNDIDRMAGPTADGNINLYTEGFSKALPNRDKAVDLAALVAHEYFIKAGLETRDKYTWSHQLTALFIDRNVNFHVILGTEFDPLTEVKDLVERHAAATEDPVCLHEPSRHGCIAIEDAYSIDFDATGCVAYVTIKSTHTFTSDRDPSVHEVWDSTRLVRVGLAGIDPDHLQPSFSNGVVRLVDWNVGKLLTDFTKPNAILSGAIQQLDPNNRNRVIQTMPMLDLPTHSATPNVAQDLAWAARQCESRIAEPRIKVNAEGVEQSDAPKVVHGNGGQRAGSTSDSAPITAVQ